jgi:hypothetical protein
MIPDPTQPPNTKAYFKFYAEKWDSEYARNVLLHFISECELNEQLISWLDEKFPDERYSN